MLNPSLKCLENTIYNLVIKVKGIDVYYFDSNGIYCKCAFYKIPHIVVRTSTDLLHNGKFVMPMKIDHIVKFKYIFIMHNSYDKFLLLLDKLKPGDSINILDRKICDLYESQVIMTNALGYDVKLNKELIINTVLRYDSKFCYFFNESGIFSAIPKEKANMPFEKFIVYSDEKRMAIPKWLIISYDDTQIRAGILNKIIKLLSPGDSLEYFEELLNLDAYALEFMLNGNGYLKVDQFITKVGQPLIERYYGNKNKSTFDIIRIYINFCNVPNYEAHVKKYFRTICNTALTKINQSYRFQKYGIPINYLKLSSFTICVDKSIELIFCLKDI